MVESITPICSLTVACPHNHQVCIQGRCLDFELSNDTWIFATATLGAAFTVIHYLAYLDHHKTISVSDCLAAGLLLFMLVVSGIPQICASRYQSATVNGPTGWSLTTSKHQKEGLVKQAKRVITAAG